jgi:uncharacterized protein
MTSHWMGTFRQDAVAFRIVVHIRDTGGDFTGGLDNLDLGIMGIPIDAVRFDQDTLGFRASSIGGLYQGRIENHRQTVTGTWRMNGAESPLLLRRVQASPIDGTWTGTLLHGEFRLRLFFYVGGGPSGPMAAMASPDQGEAVVPVHAVKLLGSALVLEITSIAARFEGALNLTGSEIGGRFFQEGLDLPLTLRRVAAEGEPKPPRPQEPSPPYPYRQENVKYRNRSAELELAGAFTVPEGQGPFPAVLLIAGSGLLDRDATIGGHRPFLVLADDLTRRGFAVLRYDKRGAGESDGDPTAATTTGLAADARAGVEYLQTRPQVDRGRIALIGHSEGGLIACMLAAERRDLAFIVLMAAPGVPGWELIVQQARRNAPLQGISEEEAERQSAELVKLLRGEPDGAWRGKLAQIFPRASRQGASLDHLLTPWYREAARLNPAEYLRRVQCPVLALNGEKDTAVEPRSNLAAIQEALRSGGNRDFETVELPGLNHLFQTCVSGWPSEYWHITETLSPALLEKIGEWITQRAF